MSETRRAIGLMSGTSMDGVDAALIETDGERIRRRGPGASRPYTDEERKLVEAAARAARDLDDRTARPPALAEAEEAVTRAHAESVRAFLAANAVDAQGVDVLGFHGQTVLHRPQTGLTVQLGDGTKLAELTGIAVVHDFRARDMAAGGQGAPFAPVYHRALVKAARLGPPVAVVNIGGVANVTWIGADDAIIAFDTGPGNGLLDDWAARHTGAAMDRDGALAARGAVEETVLTRLLDNPFFELNPPKSLDRGDFSLSGLDTLNDADGAATLTAFTAESIALARRFMPEVPKTWIVCGGGTRNPALMAALRARLEGTVRTADDLGWSGEFMEAEAFGFMAVRSLRGLPLTWPSTTGAREPISGGVLTGAR